MQIPVSKSKIFMDLSSNAATMHWSPLVNFMHLLENSNHKDIFVENH